MYIEDGKFSALLIFRLISNESTNHSTHIQQSLLFNTPKGLRAALGFLRSQADQVSQIAISTPDNRVSTEIEKARD